MAISDITSTTTRYTVVRGNTFSAIAQRCIQVNMPGYSGLSLYNAGINKLKSFNPDIDDINLISIGQVIILQGTASSLTTSISQKAKVTNFGLQANTDRRVFATWAWNKENTENYEIKWSYYTGDGVAFQGTKSTVAIKQSVYDAPENATSVAFYVKPISKKYKSGKKEVNYWNAGWSTVKRYYFSENPPAVPPIPSDISLSSLKLTIKFANLVTTAEYVEFQVINASNTIFNAGSAKVNSGNVTYSCKVNAGNEYRVRCRAVKDKQKSDWSGYSTPIETQPAATDGIYLLYALTSSSVELKWYEVSNVDNYQIEYTTSINNFDTSNQVQSASSTIGTARITGLTSGLTYFFRVRSTKVGADTPSSWSAIKSIELGTQPSPPTTWSSSSSVITGDPLILYWMHNSTDASHQTETELELDIGGTVTTYEMFYGTCTSTDESAAKTVNINDFALNTDAVIRVYMEFANTFMSPTLRVITGVGTQTNAIPIVASSPYSTYWDGGTLVTLQYDGTYWNVINYSSGQSVSSFSVDTTDYTEGTSIKWRVKTAGMLSDNGGNYIFSDWSIERTVDIYSPPTVSLSLTNSTITSFPINIIATAGPNTQTPTGYHITIKANESYETIDGLGNKVVINDGGIVYSKYLDTNENPLSISISAGDIDLENNINYTISCIVSMNSGLKGETSSEILVEWTDEEYMVDAEIGYDPETYTTVIKPYAFDEYQDLAENVTLSVYRREFDGKLTELATGLNNSEGTYITDPHPSLDLARYRIVAVASSNGAISYYDVPGYPVNEQSVLIQWDDKWTNFDVTSEDDPEQPNWSGSLLKLPYNIDTSDSNNQEVGLINYIGRSHPVSYYGTQLGQSATLNAVIDKEDSETLYGLRRLASWLGNAYVRRPDGVGYWANVKVSFSKTHNELIIPITLSITRVEGGL